MSLRSAGLRVVKANAIGLDLLEMPLSPGAKLHDRLGKRAAQGGQRIFDLRRNGRVNGARHHAVPLERLERPRKHLLGNPSHCALNLIGALRGLAKRHHDRMDMDVPHGLGGSISCSSATGRLNLPIRGVNRLAIRR